MKPCGFGDFTGSNVLWPDMSIEPSFQSRSKKANHLLTDAFPSMVRGNRPRQLCAAFGEVCANSPDRNAVDLCDVEFPAVVGERFGKPRNVLIQANFMRVAAHGASKRIISPPQEQFSVFDSGRSQDHGLSLQD